MLRRSITRGALQALAYCHDLGVVHGSLGSGSVMLSSFDDKTARRLVVKLDNVRIGASGAPSGPQRAASGAPVGRSLLFRLGSSFAEH
jgi:serine/threonine protein kinase